MTVNSLNDLLQLRSVQMNKLAENQALYRLATGLRINSGEDDPAGLIAATSMDATLATLDAESSADQRAVNVAATADAGLSQISGLLGQAQSLVSANADSTLSTD